MDKLRAKIAQYFPAVSRPGSHSLVVDDGFEGLEKNGAMAFYADKSWEEVLKHLRNLKNEQVFGAAYYLEEWSVLSDTALSYYIRAHLEYLIDQLNGKNSDVLFVLYFIGQLYQVAYIHKGSPFSQEQTAFLKEMVGTVVALTKGNGDYDGLDIEQCAAQFVAALG